MTAAALDLKRRVAEAADLVTVALDELLPRAEGPESRLTEAMRYAALGPGKRLRPFFAIETGRMFGLAERSVLRAACALELIHAYSLVHDDLPCMDDDDLRRGRPTTHRQFDEATAVLAGDALLTLAFGILADPATHPSAEVRGRLVGKLAEAGGAAGMIGGQMLDMQAAESDFGEDEIIQLQALKTGALFEFCCEAGPILGGAGAEEQQRLRAFARDFGLAFQIADDIIDATGDVEEAGKAVGKDQDQGKATLISLYGLEKARSEAHRLAHSAADRLSPYGAAADDLRALPFLLLDRPS